MLEQDKKRLLKLARESIESKFTNKEIDIPEGFHEKRGVFVTLTIDKKLRGCIGFIKPVHTIKESIISATKAAAFHDPRFPPLTEDELRKIKIEISLLTKPEIIENDPKNIDIGKDGLIIAYGLNKGLLLPQVATENNMNQEEFLCQACLKAGLSPNAWKDKDCKVYKFQAEIFKED